MRRPSRLTIAVLAWDLAALIFLACALVEARSLPDPPAVPIQGGLLSEAGNPPDEPASQAVFDEDGVLLLAALEIVGYDPPEVRADPSPWG